MKEFRKRVPIFTIRSFAFLQYSEAAFLYNDIRTGRDTIPFDPGVIIKTAKEETKVKIGISQMCTGSDLEQNMRFIETSSMKMAEEGVKIAAFPECAVYLSGDAESMRKTAEPLDGKIIGRLQALASRLHIYLHNGSFIEKENGRLYNTSVLIGPEGTLEAVYRKIHLFDMDVPGVISEKESDLLTRGEAVTVKRTDMGTLGMAICYDLRFPEQFRRMVEKGAEIIFVPAAFALYTGKEHWEVLLRARAIENQVYIVAADQTGLHYEGKSSNGHSMIIDPWGCVVAQCGNHTGYVTADVNMEYLEKVRREAPYLKHIVEISG